ncbi:hypothetical protein GVAV_002591 [Gurleya vavrai]
MIIFFSIKIHSCHDYDLRFKELLIELFDTPFIPNETCELTSPESTLKRDDEILIQSISECLMSDLEKNNNIYLKISQDKDAPSYLDVGADHFELKQIFDIDLESTQINVGFPDNKKLDNLIKKNEPIGFKTTSNEIVDLTCYNNEILTNVEKLNSTIEFDNILKVYYYKKSLKAKKNFKLRYVKSKILKKYKKVEKNISKKLSNKFFHDILLLRKTYYNIKNVSSDIIIDNKIFLYKLNEKNGKYYLIQLKKNLKHTDERYNGKFFDGEISIKNYKNNLNFYFNKKDYVERLTRHDIRIYYDIFIKAEKKFHNYIFKMKTFIMDEFFYMKQGELFWKLKLLYHKTDDFFFILMNFCYLVNHFIIKKGLNIHFINTLYDSININPINQLNDHILSNIKQYFIKMLKKNLRTFIFLFPECIFLLEILDLYKNIQLKFVSSKEAILFYLYILIFEKFLQINWKNYLDSIKKKIINFDHYTYDERNKEVLSLKNSKNYIGCKKELMYYYLKLKYTLNEILLYILSKYIPFYIYSQLFELKKFENLNLIYNFQIRYDNDSFVRKLKFKFTFYLIPLFFSHTYINEQILENVESRKKNSFNAFYLEKKKTTLTKYLFKIRFKHCYYNDYVFLKSFLLSVEKYVYNDVDYFTNFSEKLKILKYLNSDFNKKFQRIRYGSEWFIFYDLNTKLCLEAFEEAIDVLQCMGLINFL